MSLNLFALSLPLVCSSSNGISVLLFCGFLSKTKLWHFACSVFTQACLNLCNWNGKFWESLCCSNYHTVLIRREQKFETDSVLHQNKFQNSVIHSLPKVRMNCSWVLRRHTISDLFWNLLQASEWRTGWQNFDFALCGNRCRAIHSTMP